MQNSPSAQSQTVTDSLQKTASALRTTLQVSLLVPLRQTSKHNEKDTFDIRVFLLLYSLPFLVSFFLFLPTLSTLHKTLPFSCCSLFFSSPSFSATFTCLLSLTYFFSFCLSLLVYVQHGSFPASLPPVTPLLSILCPLWCFPFSVHSCFPSSSVFTSNSTAYSTPSLDICGESDICASLNSSIVGQGI